MTLNCSAFDDEESPLAERAYDELRTIQAHEEAQVEALGTGGIRRV